MHGYLSREAILQVQLALIRLQGSKGDIIVTLSTPEADSAASRPPEQGSQASMGSQQRQAQLFEAMCKTMQMNDRSLLA